MLRKRKTLDAANYVYGAEAGKILGISRVTFYDRVRYKKYDHIRKIENRRGRKYLIHDIFRIAHPSVHCQVHCQVTYWTLL